MSPAYIGVGYIIGPELAALNFSGSVLAWGLMVPLLIFFLGPQLQVFLPAGSTDASWIGLANAVWRYIVRPIAVGGMMVGAATRCSACARACSTGWRGVLRSEAARRQTQQTRPAPSST